MLSSLGIRAYTIFTESFLVPIAIGRLSVTQSSSFITGLGQRHLLAGLGGGWDVRPDNVWRCCAGKINRDTCLRCRFGRQGNEKPEVRRQERRPDLKWIARAAGIALLFSFKGFTSIIRRYFVPVFLSLSTGLTSNKMTSATDIRNQVIDQLMAIKDAGYLRALSDMINSSHVQEEVVPLTEEQKIMLLMSEEDIKAGRTIDQLTLNERELEWLKKK